MLAREVWKVTARATPRVCAFSAAVFVLVRAQLLRDLDAVVARDLATIERTYREADYDLVEVETRAGVELFEVVRDGRVLYRTASWSRIGLDEAVAADGAATWVSPGGRTYRVAGRSWDGLRIAAAVDEATTRRALDRLALVLALGIPCAATVALGGGLLLARRVLAPVGAMASTRAGSPPSRSTHGCPSTFPGTRSRRARSRTSACSRRRRTRRSPSNPAPRSRRGATRR
jgi:hypothetical protein